MLKRWVKAARRSCNIIHYRSWRNKGYGKGEDHYKVLGIKSDATRTEVIKAYHKIASEHHPDHLGDCSLEELEKSLRVLRRATESYQIMKSNVEREKYDRRMRFGAISNPRSRATKEDEDYYIKVVAQHLHRTRKDKINLQKLKQDRPDLLAKAHLSFKFSRQEQHEAFGEVRTEMDGRDLKTSRKRHLTYDEWQEKLKRKRGMLNASGRVNAKELQKVSEASEKSRRTESGISMSERVKDFLENVFK